jgi:hypothetical protein
VGDSLQIGVTEAVAQDQGVILIGFQHLFLATLAAQHQQAGVFQQFRRCQQGEQLAQQFLVEFRHQLHDVADFDALAVQVADHVD